MNKFDAFAALWQQLSKASNADFLQAIEITETLGPVSSAGLESALRGIGGFAGRRRLAEMARLAQSIDTWARPINPPYSGLGDEHAEALARLRIDGYLNEDVSFGKVIPKHSAWTRRPDSESDPPKLRDLFDQLLVFPSQLEATDADDALYSRRLISVKYKRVYSSAPDLPDRGKPVVTAVIPVLDAMLHARFDIFNREGRDWYSIYPEDRMEHVVEALALAARRGAQIVLLPEMAIPSGQLPALCSAVRNFAVSQPFSLVVAGICDPAPSRGYARNRLVALDHLGEIIVEQDKLFRWNLDDNQRRRFGMGAALPPTSKLYENISQTSEVTIFDWHGFGRIALLICADLSAAEPKGWIHEHLLIDWTFVILMDGEIKPGRWAYTLGRELAAASGGRVVIANSGWLTVLNNAQNAIASVPPVEEPNVAFFDDGLAPGPVLRAINLSRPEETVFAAYTEEGWQ